MSARTSAADSSPMLRKTQEMMVSQPGIAKALSFHERLTSVNLPTLVPKPLILTKSLSSSPKFPPVSL
jgi:hypothetical protein